MTWTYAEAKKRHEDENNDEQGAFLREELPRSYYTKAHNDRAELIQLVEKLGEALAQAARDLESCESWTENRTDAAWMRRRIKLARAALKELT